MLLKTFWCESGTPFGAASEPLVNRITQVSSGFVSWLPKILVIASGLLRLRHAARSFRPVVIFSFRSDSSVTTWSAICSKSIESKRSKKRPDVRITFTPPTSKTCWMFASPTVQLIITGTLPASNVAMITIAAPLVDGNMMPMCLSGYSAMMSAKTNTPILARLYDITPLTSSPIATALPPR